MARTEKRWYREGEFIDASRPCCVIIARAGKLWVSSALWDEFGPLADDDEVLREARELRDKYDAANGK